MFKRVFKLILVGTLIFGITVPSKAAVSVSDGSAFVTKAEFSADLNNLSNRMAQLENSLDAKIDSLVSSYLTRNGIWNGAKQEQALECIWLSLNKNSTTARTIRKGQNGYLGDKDFENVLPLYYNNLKTPSSYSAGVMYNIEVMPVVEIVKKCNKSGLCCLTLAFGNVFTYSGNYTDNRDIYFKMQQYGRFLSNTGAYLKCFTTDKDDNNDTDRFLCYYLKGMADPNDAQHKSEYHTVHYGLESNKSTYQFFVSKDDKIKFSSNWFYQGYGGTTNFALNTDFIANCDAGWGPFFSFNDIAIY